MGQPVRVGEAVRQLLHGVFRRQYNNGVRFRSRDQKLADVLVMVQHEYPEARQEDLVGDLSEFSKVLRQPDECDYDKENHRCPRECSNLGRLWEVVQQDTRSGPVYFVWYRPCGIYHSWREERQRQREERTIKTEGTIAPFSTKGESRFEY